MRCPDCNKFVSFDADTEPEMNVEFDAQALGISGDVRIANNCADCGTELKETTFTIDDISVEDEVHEHWKQHGWTGKGVAPEGHQEIEMSDDGGSRTERTQTKDRHGKPIKSSRYMRHYYGAEATFTITCECGETICEKQWSDEIQGSGMDELV